MKKCAVILFVVMLASILRAQQDMIVISRPVTQGTNFVQNTEIQATEYMFQERIDKFNIDTASGTVAVHLRGLSKNGKYLNNSGSFVLYDLKTQMPLWSRKINFQTENIELVGSQVLLLRPGKVTGLNMATGAEMWTGKNRIYFADKENGIGVGYKFNSLNPTSDNLEGIDLQTGNTIWNRDVDRTYGWNDIQRLNDSVLLITSAGLHAVNLKTGEGWDYKTPTGKKQTGEAVAKGVGSVLLGVLTGVTVIPNVDVITGLVSNTWVDSSGIYLASAEKISRLNPSDGDIIWSNDLPKDMCSASSIFRKNGTIYLINKGYAFENGRTRDYGHPFLAIYNENDGSRMFFRSFEEKKLTLNDVDVQGDTVNLLFYNKIAQFSVSADSLLAERTFDTQKTGYLYNFANENIYFQQNDTFVRARQDKSKQLIMTSNGNVLILNEKMETEQELSTTEYHRLHFGTPACKLLYKDGNMALVSNEGKRLAVIKTSSTVQLKGTKLYETEGKVLSETDLTDLIR